MIHVIALGIAAVWLGPFAALALFFGMVIWDLIS